MRFSPIRACCGERAHREARFARRRDAGRDRSRRARVRALLGLGANLGDPVATLNEAKTRLAAHRPRDGGVVALPHAALGRDRSAAFVNAALAFETALDPMRFSPRSKRSSVNWGASRAFVGAASDRSRHSRRRRRSPGRSAARRSRTRACSSAPSHSSRWRRSNPAFAAARDALPPDDLAAVERIGAFEREGER